MNSLAMSHMTFGLYAEALAHSGGDPEQTTFLTMTPRELAILAAGLNGLVLSSIYLPHVNEIADLMEKITNVIAAQHGERDDGEGLDYTKEDDDGIGEE